MDLSLFYLHILRLSFYYKYELQAFSMATIPQTYTVWPLPAAVDKLLYLCEISQNRVWLITFLISCTRSTVAQYCCNISPVIASLDTPKAIMF